MVGSISCCYAQVEPNSEVIDSQQQEKFDPVIDALMTGVIENQDQLELITVEEQQNFEDQVNIDSYQATIQYRELQEKHKLWVVLLISAMTPLFLFLVLHFLKNSSDNSGGNIVNVTGLILVIQATVLIVVTSTTSEQLTAAIGVIAAIAGYLFGSSKQKS